MIKLVPKTTTWAAIWPCNFLKGNLFSGYDLRVIDSVWLWTLIQWNLLCETPECLVRVKQVCLQPILQCEKKNFVVLIRILAIVPEIFIEMKVF